MVGAGNLTPERMGSGSNDLSSQESRVNSRESRGRIRPLLRGPDSGLLTQDPGLSTSYSMIRIGFPTTNAVHVVVSLTSPVYTYLNLYQQPSPVQV